MNFKKNILKRVRALFFVLFIVTIAIFYNIINIQFVEDNQWKQMGQENAYIIKDIHATRGNIYSDDGSLLATSLPFYQLSFDPYLSSDEVFNKGIDSLSFLLSNFYKDLQPLAYKNKIITARKSKRRYVLLNKKEIGFQEKKVIENFPIFREGRLKGGVIFEKIEKRFLPFSQLGHRIIGKLNQKEIGASGLEYSFNKYLSGKEGNAIHKKMASGGWRPIYDGTETKPIDGYDIETTLNVNIQDLTETELLKMLTNTEADYGVAIVMEVKTGEVKAMSNLSRGTSGKYYETYNYAAGNQGVREPGSTFKLASMIALFEDSDVELNDLVDTGNGQYNFYNVTMHDYKEGGFGILSVKQIFEYSSNIGVAKLITQHFGNNPERFIYYLEKMHINKPLGFQMAGEGVPYVKQVTDSTWSGTTLPWMSQGYELKMTPLHTLTLYNAVANDGTMVQPVIVRKILKTDKVVESFKPLILNEKICSDKTLSKIKQLLVGVVERGTAKNIYSPELSIAGKTGTAKKYNKGVYTNKYYSSFVGFFPAENPKFSCIVVIDNPKNDQRFGGDVAAPVFKEIAQKIYANHIDIQQNTVVQQQDISGVFPVVKSGNSEDLKIICQNIKLPANQINTDAKWLTTKIENNKIGWEVNKVDQYSVPDVRGMTLRDAIYILENLGMKVELEGDGRVLSQSIEPGFKFFKDKKIKLILG